MTVITMSPNEIRLKYHACGNPQTPAEDHLTALFFELNQQVHCLLIFTSTPNPTVSPGNAMIVPGSSFSVVRLHFVIC
jgi:hypothetical protein